MHFKKIFNINFYTQTIIFKNKEAMPLLTLLVNFYLLVELSYNIKITKIVKLFSNNLGYFNLFLHKRGGIKKIPPLVCY